MRPMIDLTGRELAGWRVIESTAERSRGGDVMWFCECLTCGIRKPVRGDNLRGGAHRRGCTSCRGRRSMALSDQTPEMKAHKRSLTQHVWPRVCDFCREPFRGTAKQRYCTTSCRDKAQYRRDKTKNGG